MKKYLYAILLLILSASVIKPQEIKTPFNERQLIEKSLHLRKEHKNTAELNKLSGDIYKLLPDSLVAEITASINADSVKMFIKGLQNFGSRFAFATNRDTVVEWIKQKYLAMGFTDVVVDSFLYSDIWHKNIIATLPGKNKNEICLIGGHYDSITSDYDYNLAPGADDNASGTSVALEVARVLKQKNYIPECTIKFINFGAEELGLIGSNDYAIRCSKEGLNIKLMINADMISYSSHSLDSSYVAINSYRKSEYWVPLTKQMVSKYSKLTPIDGEENSEYSDSYPFWANGYKVIYFMEEQFSPYYHSGADTLGNYNMPYCAEVIKSACAVLLNACYLPGPVQKLALRDVGDGKTVYASWQKSVCNDFKEYKVYIGTESNVYDTSFTTKDTLIELKPVLQNNMVYVAVTNITNSGNESAPVEKSTYITSAPFSPNILLCDVNRTTITISLFNDNKALYYAGFDIYRSDSLNGVYKKINTSILNDSIYYDQSAKKGIYYFYKAQALYTNGAKSEFSNIVKGRLATLDGGIGLVITGKNGNGSPGSPTLQQINSFFDNILKEFSPSKLNVEYNNVSISELGFYSSIIWHDNSDMFLNPLYISTADIQKYLLMGGKILISTDLPMDKFRYGLIMDTTKFKTGDFEFDFLKIGTRILPSYFDSYFSGAAAKLQGYNNLQVDTNKTGPEYNYQLTDIESIAPNESAKSIYSFASKSDTCQMNGRSVAVEYLGTDYKSILLSFPLYFMKEEQVKNFLKFVLTNKFSEPVAVKQNYMHPLPNDFSLAQNYPNPFNPATNISFDLPFNSKVKLSVYNSLGQQVAVLFDNVQSAGRHSIQFNAGRLASGVYFYVLNARPLTGNGYSYHASRKMILIK